MTTLVLFDIDGTLLKTRGAGREATRLAMIEVFGTSAAVASHHFGGKTDWQSLVELLESEGFSEAAIVDLLPHYDRTVGRITESIIPGYAVEACVYARETVEALRQRSDILLGIVTGNSSNAAPHKLRAGGYDPGWFKVGAFGSEARHRNQLTPLAVQRAATLLGHEPQPVIVVGDTPMDVDCARAINAVAVAVETGFSSHDELIASAPDYLIADLRDFSRILDAAAAGVMHS